MLFRLPKAKMREEIRSANSTDVVSTVVASFIIYVVRVIDPESRPIHSKAVMFRQLSFMLILISRFTLPAFFKFKYFRIIVYSHCPTRISTLDCEESSSLPRP